jgi:hypothetical protein
MGYGRCPFSVGKEISYCHSCGHRILEAEPSFQHDHRRFCLSCSPAGAVPLEPRRQTSTRIRAAAVPAPRPRETTRVRKKNPVVLIAGVASAAALAVGLAIAASGAPAPEPAPVVATVPPVQAPLAPKTVPGPTLDELLSRIRELRQADLMFDRRDDVLALLKDAAERSGPRLEEVDQIAVEYDRKFEQAAARLADFTRSEAMRMASKQKFAEAIERLDGYPAPFRTSKSAGQIRELRQEFERRRLESAPGPAGPQRQVVGTPRWRS